MKEPISEANHDIDAGWDEIAPTTAPISITVKTVDSQPPEVEDLDAGWDVELAGGGSQPEKARAPKPKVTGNQSAPSAPSQASLTRKAKKELERQARFRETQRKADAREQRKEKRRAVVAHIDDARHAGAKRGSQGDAPTKVQPAQPRPKKKSQTRAKAKPERKVHRAEITEPRREELGSRQQERLPMAQAQATPEPQARTTLSATTKVAVGLFVVLLVAAIVRWMR